MDIVIEVAVEAAGELLSAGIDAVVDKAVKHKSEYKSEYRRKHIMAIKSLIINPGSTSTKIGVFEDENLLFEETLRHSTEEISKYDTIFEQKDFRKKIITDLLAEKNCDLKSFNSCVLTLFKFAHCRVADADKIAELFFLHIPINENLE